MSGVTFNWYTLGGALIIAAAAAIFAYYRYLQEQKHQRNTLLNSLFSEIANIYEHYSYAAHEIPTTLEDEFEIQKRLRWSFYGKISSISDIEKLGFLSALNIKALLQLGLLIRNDDMLLQQLQEKKEEITPERLKYLKGRFKDRIENSERIISELIKSYPHLHPIFENIKSQFL